MNDFTNRLRAEIIAVGNGRYTLSLGTYSLDADFFKIERLAEGSNYYLLWPDAQRDDFYLYNAKNRLTHLIGYSSRKLNITLRIACRLWHTEATITMLICSMKTDI